MLSRDGDDYIVYEPVSPPVSTLDEREYVWQVTLQGFDEDTISVRVLEYTKERAAQRAAALYPQFSGRRLAHPITIPGQQITKYNGWRKWHPLAEGLQ